MESVQNWLETKFLEYQLAHGRMTLTEFAELLGISKGLLSQLMTGSRDTCSMKSAYQIGERLGDFSILTLLGYPVPIVPLEGFSSDEKVEILSWLEKVKIALASEPEPDRLKKLNEILEELPDTSTSV